MLRISGSGRRSHTGNCFRSMQGPVLHHHQGQLCSRLNLCWYNQEGHEHSSQERFRLPRWRFGECWVISAEVHV